jgi:deoxycytidylate deaminase
MEQCKRYLVQCVGIDKQGHIRYATNYNETTCKNEVGNCGCIHAEIAMLNKLPAPVVVFLSTSPCLACAKELVKAGVLRVIYQTEYRIKDGIKYLVDNGVVVYNSIKSTEEWTNFWDREKAREDLKHG